MHFFWPNLRCKVIEQMVKSHYLVEFPAQKKGTKMVPIWVVSKRILLFNGQKKVPKIGPHQVANACPKCQIFIWRCKPNAAQPNAAAVTACQKDDRIETYCGRPWLWGWQNCNFRAQKLEPHLLVKVHSASAPWLNHCRPQCNIRMAAEIDIAIFENITFHPKHPNFAEKPRSGVKITRNKFEMHCNPTVPP